MSSEHQHHHRRRHASASSGHAEDRAQRGNRRGAASASGASSESLARPTASQSAHHQRSVSRSASAGRQAAALCVFSAFLGLGLALLGEAVSRINQTAVSPAVNLFAGALTLAAVGAGAYAQASQLRLWSRRVRKRLLIGLPVAVLTGLVVAANWIGETAPPAHVAAEPAPRAPAADPAQPDGTLCKAGWYGELQQDGVWLVLTSFPDDAFEAKLFGRGLLKPVSYATLSIINTGNTAPLVLRSFQVTLHLATGEEVQSHSLQQLTAWGTDRMAEIAKRLAAPYSLPLGGMIPDVPVCLEQGFDWARVSAVTVTVGQRALTLRGRMMSAAEKLSLLQQSPPPPPTNAPSARAAETWYKNL